MTAPAAKWLGQSVERVEDAALLTGFGRYIDDLGIRPGTQHAAILRSPHAHAAIRAIRTDAARRSTGVVAVLTGAEVTAISTSLVVGVKAPIQCWPIAVDRVRYVGEPVAVVVAADRYLAEDAVDLIEVDYDPLPVLIDPRAALDPAQPLLHEGLGSNVASDRSFRYGDPERAFAECARRVAVDIHYPRNSCTPIETYGLVAEYDSASDAYDILANFQGPFSMHPVMARALKVPGNRLRLRTPPDSGGSFGVKQGIFPYIVLMGLAARVAGRPVKWIEDRLEHLTASVSATNRVTHLEAAVGTDGRIAALAWDQIEDVGAHIRAPEPATLYRMHGNLTGAYDIRNVSVRNRVVLTNKTPTGLNRGFGGPQVYYALERLLQRIAVELEFDPLEVIRRNLVPSGVFPHRTATGGLLDSGDYPRTLDAAVQEGGLKELLARRETARAEGRIYGIGYTAVVEPSVSNMGYITTVLTAKERQRAGAKNGAQATATISLDPVGAVSVQIASVPQGQGHRTVVAQIVADAFGLTPRDIRVVSELDTTRDAWSIASGNYSSRFAPAVGGAVHLAAMRVKEKLQRTAAAQLNVSADEIEFVDGKVRARGNPDNALPFGRVAATSHWSPGIVPDGAQVLRETVFWSPPELTAPSDLDEVNSSLCHGFIFDFCGVEIDRTTGALRIDKYVTMHDCGRILHPRMVAGQITGGFAHALGAAVYEEYAYSPDGNFLAGTFADYLLPTTMEVPEPVILHFESPSPFTPLGAKGVGEGNCMSTPVCLANSVADALGIKDINLPLTPAKLAAYLHPPEGSPPDHSHQTDRTQASGKALHGAGTAIVGTSQDNVWRALLDADTLATIIPGCHNVEKISDTHFRADVTIGIGPVKGRYRAEVTLSDLDPPHAATLTGSATGALGFGAGSGRVTLTSDGEATRLTYTYEAEIGGKIASIGGRLLDAAARLLIREFFAALARRLGGPKQGWLARLRGAIGGRQ
ncbi:MAG: 2-furoyl-CoA dehydrogenase large subunit [Alphaproteobacteria bacterium]|nr:2-furoyl-CoA dehydrogenase large subunit [Alphaproteobacteria bacterium]